MPLTNPTINAVIGGLPKKYTLNILDSHTKQEPQQFFVPALKRHIVLNSAMIRDAAGQATGAIIALTNMEKRKQTKEDEI